MTRVVLLGGGYVTLHAYATLVRRLGRDRPARRARDRRDLGRSRTPVPRLHGRARRRHDRPRPPRHAARRGDAARADHRSAEPSSIDADRRRCRTARGDDAPVEALRYDHLVVGHRRQGADGGGRRASSRYGFTLRGPGRDRRARRPPRDAFRARPSSSPEAGSRASSSPPPSPTAGIRSPWCTPAAAILGEWDDQPRLVARAETELARLGVTVLAGRRLVEVTPTTARAVRRHDARVRHGRGGDRAASRAHPRARPVARRARPAADAAARSPSGTACGRRATRRGSSTR